MTLEELAAEFAAYKAESQKRIAQIEQTIAYRLKLAKGDKGDPGAPGLPGKQTVVQLQVPMQESEPQREIIGHKWTPQPDGSTIAEPIYKK